MNFGLIFVILISLTIGSFLNVCIYRIPRGESIVFPPSHCPYCKTKIKPYDLIPIISFIILKGRCRWCKEKISARYPLVEASSLLCGILSFYRYGFSIDALIVFILGLLLIYISAVDIENFEISNAAILFLYLVTSIYFFKNNPFSAQSVSKFFLGSIYSSALIFLIFLLSKERAMGFGDVLLMFCGSCGFDFKKAMVVNFLSFVTGAIYGFFALMLQREKSHLIPFAPFISLSIYLTLLFGQDIINLYINIFF